MYRLLADCVMILSVLFLPWWAVIILGSVFFMTFDSYYEFLFFALLSDVLFSVPLARFGGFEAVQVVLSVVLFGCLSLIKKRVRV